MHIQLTGAAGFPEGTVFPVDKPVTVIGRAADADIVLPDPFVSSRHAEIHLADAGALLRDCSKNGTLVDTVKAEGDVVLADGQEITIHPYVLRVAIGESDEVTRVIAVPEPGTAVVDPDQVAAPEKNTPETAGTPDVSERTEAPGGKKKEDIPRGRMILYGVLAAGFLGMILYGQFSGDDAGSADAWQDNAVRPAARGPENTPGAVPPAPRQKTAAELKKEITDALEVAQSMSGDRTRKQNLYHSIIKLEEALGLADQHGITLTGEKGYRDLLDKARRTLKETHGTLLTEAKILVKQKNYRGAVEVLLRITELIPNQKDPRHRDARQRIYKYQKYLR